MSIAVRKTGNYYTTFLASNKNAVAWFKVKGAKAPSVNSRMFCTEIVFLGATELHITMTLAFHEKTRRVKVMHTWRLQTLSVLLGVGIASAPFVMGQNKASGSVSGTVKDKTGAIITNATVTATRTATGIATKATTNSVGIYIFPTLPVGTYTLDFTAPSFARLHIGNLEVYVGSTIRQDATLTAGSATATVTVSATADLLQTGSVETGQLLGGNQMTQLPILDRDIYSLLDLTAGTESGVNMSNGANVFVTAERPTVAGGRAGFTVFRTDGIDINSQNLPSASFSVSPDAVEQFRSVTALGDATESGDSSVDLITKSGTDNFHGDLYEFFRNNVLDALPYFFVPSPPIPGFKAETNQLRYNEFGGTLGGPILKHKLFFFASIQAMRDSVSNQLHEIFPTAQELAGNYNGTFDPTKNTNFGTALSPEPINPATGSPYPGNQITPSVYFSAFAKQAIADGFFIPSNCNACESIPDIDADWVGNAGASASDTQYFSRIDNHLSNNDQLYGTFLVEPFTFPDLISPMPITNTVFTSHQYEASVSETHIFTDRLINEFHLGYTRAFSGFGQPTDINAHGADVFPNAPFANPQNYLSLYVAGMSAPFGNGGLLGDDEDEIEDSIDMNDEVTWTHGRHVVKAGVEGIRARFFVILDLNGLLVYADDLPSAFDFTGDGFSDFETGTPLEAVTEQGTGAAPGVKRYNWDEYVQDVWKMKPNFTVDAGLRYEIQGRWRDVDPNLNRLSTLDLSSTSAALGGIFLLANQPNYVLARTGLVVKGTGAPLVGPTIVNPEYNDVMPRLGVTWQPSASSKTVVRAGAGIYYPIEDANRIAFEINSIPYKFTSTFVNIPHTFSDATLFPKAITGSASTEGELPDNRDPRAYEWTLSVERQLGEHTLATLEYIGNQGSKLPLAYLSNQAPLPTAAQTAAILKEVGPGGNVASVNTAAAATRIPFADVGPTYLSVRNGSTSSYNAFNATLEGTYARRLTYTAVYTWSKALDFASSEQDIPMDTYDMAYSKGYSAYDHPQRFVGSWIYNLPFGDTVWRRSNHIANGFINGWELSGDAAFEAGAPFSIEVGEDTSLRGDYPDNIVVYANLNGKLHKTNPRRTGEYLSMTNLSVPAFGTLGNTRRNEFHGPGVNNFDMALIKNTNLFRGTALQIRAEAFNVFNHAQFVLGNVTLGEPGVGATVGADGTTPVLTPLPTYGFAAVSQQAPLLMAGFPGGGARIVQLAAKFTF